jgi:hypothetical protein
MNEGVLRKYVLLGGVLLIPKITWAPFGVRFSERGGSKAQSRSLPSWSNIIQGFFVTNIKFSSLSCF